MKSTILTIVALSLASSLQAATSHAPKGDGTVGTQSPPIAGGNVLYENGSSDINTDSGNEMTNWLQADDFQLGVAGVAMAADADWFLFGGGVWDGTIQWTIYLDAGGSPGAVHASGNGSGIVTTPLGNAQGFTWFNSRWNLGQAVNLAANQRYWLGLHFSADCGTRDDVYWGYSQQQAFNFSQEQTNCAGAWLPVTNEDRAFTLFTDLATPVESATWGAIKSQYRD
jgi:hypothetical protein